MWFSRRSLSVQCGEMPLLPGSPHQACYGQACQVLDNDDKARDNIHACYISLRSSSSDTKRQRTQCKANRHNDAQRAVGSYPKVRQCAFLSQRDRLKIGIGLQGGVWVASAVHLSGARNGSHPQTSPLRHHQNDIDM